MAIQYVKDAVYSTKSCSSNQVEVSCITVIKIKVKNFYPLKLDQILQRIRGLYNIRRKPDRFRILHFQVMKSVLKVAFPIFQDAA